MLPPRPGAASYRHPQRGLPRRSPRGTPLLLGRAGQGRAEPRRAAPRSAPPPTNAAAVTAPGGFFPPSPLRLSARTTLPSAPRGAGRGARWGAWSWGRTCGGTVVAGCPRRPREAVSVGERGAAVALQRAGSAGAAGAGWRLRHVEVAREGGREAFVCRVWPQLRMCASCGLGFGGRRSCVGCPHLGHSSPERDVLEVSPHSF